MSQSAASGQEGSCLSDWSDHQRGRKELSYAEIGDLFEAGCVAISDDGLPVMNSLVMRRAMEYAKAFGMPDY